MDAQDAEIAVRFAFFDRLKATLMATIRKATPNRPSEASQSPVERQTKLLGGVRKALRARRFLSRKSRLNQIVGQFLPHHSDEEMRQFSVGVPTSTGGEPGEGFCCFADGMASSKTAVFSHPT